MANVSWQQVKNITGSTAPSAVGAVVIDLAKGFLDARLEGEDANRGLLLLAAHLWETMEPKIASEGAGGLTVQYALPSLGDGLRGTTWGLQYLALLNAKHGADLPIVL